MSAPQSMVLYRGPSMIDGAPIIAVATFGSRNAKTGSMVQTWIMRADVAPHDAVKTGDDASVCGQCPLRPFLASARPSGLRPCYVKTWQAPRSVWLSARSKPVTNLVIASERVKGMTLRLGSYGDPAAVPVEIWRALVASAAGWTGYTRSWAYAPALAAPLRALCMASAHTASEARTVARLGWRYFRPRAIGAPMLTGEISCPASSEAGNRTQCERCTLCKGASLTAKSITIQTH